MIHRIKETGKTVSFFSANTTAALFYIKIYIGKCILFTYTEITAEIYYEKGINE